MSNPTLFTQETKESLSKWALTQPKNVEHFLEEIHYPATGTYIKVDDDGKLHMRVVFVDKFTQDEGVKLGYEWYLKCITTSGEVTRKLAKKNWLKKHNKVFPKVNEGIRNHHGIVCLLKGLEDMDDKRNTVVLHFCDVLIITLRQELGLNPPNVIIKSQNLQSIGPNVTNVFFQTDEMLGSQVDESEKQFILQNADYYYHMYGLWQNYSNKPIRLENTGIERMVFSSQFSNDERFKSHQQGKYNALKRRVHDDMGKTLYICI